jgi:hypothetical protein
MNADKRGSEKTENRGSITAKIGREGKSDFLKNGLLSS